MCPQRAVDKIHPAGLDGADRIGLIRIFPTYCRYKLGWDVAVFFGCFLGFGRLECSTLTIAALAGAKKRVPGGFRRPTGDSAFAFSRRGGLW